MDVKYYILPNSIILSVDGTSHLIGDADPRFCRVRDAVQAKTYETLPHLLDPVTAYDLNRKIVVRDGLLWLDNKPMPAALGDKLIENKLVDKPTIPLVNLWYNKTKNGENFSPGLIQALRSNACYPVTHDGFFFVYDSSKTKVEQLENLPLYDFSQVTHFKEDFAERLSITEIASKRCGFSEPKLLKIMAKEMFTEGRIRTDIVAVGMMLKGCLSRDNFYTAWQNVRDRVPADFKVEALEQTNKLLSQFSETKILHFFDKNVHLDLLLDCGMIFGKLQNVDLSNVKISNVEKLHTYLANEEAKLTPLQELKQESFCPDLAKVDGVEVNDMVIVVAKTNHELMYWGRVLNNCIGTPAHGHANAAAEGKEILLGVLRKGGMPLYNILIQRGEIIQFMKNFNKRVTEQEGEAVAQVLRKVGVVYGNYFTWSPN